jgi:hypothetical protein
LLRGVEGCCQQIVAFEVFVVGQDRVGHYAGAEEAEKGGEGGENTLPARC